jgi:magnesium chelatase subunit D
MSEGRALLPFSAVVGLDQAKQALLLAACEPRLGGVLLRGDKGSAKTTLARGLAALLPGDAPFVELPLGATEDRVIGSIDAGELLQSGRIAVRPGLLQAADGGVLYVDEINLLADHLVDALLDAAVTGVGRIERDGVSHTYAARFVLVGSMNPEEGELRPQLLDRFGLAVDVVTPDDPATRAMAVRRQLDAEHGTAASADHADDQLRRRVEVWRRAELPDDVVELASSVAVAVGAEGLRADLMLSRAAAALAGWEGRDLATAADVRAVAPLVLAHRARRRPFDDPGVSEDEIDDAFEQAQAPGAPPPATSQGDDRSSDDRGSDDPAVEQPPARLPASPTRAAAPATSGRRDPTAGRRGRFVRDVPMDESAAATDVAVVPTAIATAQRRAVEPDVATRRSDLRTAVREDRTARLIVFVVDTSGSMGADRRLATAKGAVLGLLTDAYEQRDRVALISFRGDRAEVVLRPTGSVEIARGRLEDLPVGGATPLAAALDETRALIRRAASQHDLAPTVVLITDGRATTGADPVTEARDAAARLAAERPTAVVIDAEVGVVKLGLAGELATILGADHFDLADLDAAAFLTRLRTGEAT